MHLPKTVMMVFPKADRILYVVRQDCVAMNRIVDTVESLSKDESKLMGFVLNGTVQSIGSYDKYGYGSYSYGKYDSGYYGKYGCYHNYSKY